MLLPVQVATSDDDFLSSSEGISQLTFNDGDAKEPTPTDDKNNNNGTTKPCTPQGAGGFFAVIIA